MKGNGHGLYEIRPLSASEARLDDGYIVKNLISSGSMTVLYGESGSGKTFLALHLALCVAAGTEFFEHRVRQVGVVYVAAEAGKGIDNRLAAAKLENALSWPGIVAFGSIVSPIDLCREDVDAERLIGSIRRVELGEPVGLIVIDTLSRAMAGGNENQPDDMGSFVSRVDRIREATGAAVLLVHHTGKDISRGARGHSLLRAATDSEIEVSHDAASKIHRALVTKQREYATNGNFSFLLRQVELGEDSDGDPVTSCVVEPTDDQGKPAAKVRLTDACQLALSSLRKALTEMGETPPASNHIPANARVVNIEAWRRYHYLGTAEDGRSAHARKVQFQRDRQKLQALGVIGFHAELCWIAQPH